MSTVCRSSLPAGEVDSLIISETGSRNRVVYIRECANVIVLFVLTKPLCFDTRSRVWSITSSRLRYSALCLLNCDRSLI